MAISRPHDPFSPHLRRERPPQPLPEAPPADSPEPAPVTPPEPNPGNDPEREYVVPNKDKPKRGRRGRAKAEKPSAPAEKASDPELSEALANLEAEKASAEQGT